MLAAGSLLATRFAVAQQVAHDYRVGVICSFSPLTGQEYLEALRERLAVHGFVDGRNLAIEPRFSGAYCDARDSAQGYARELIAKGADAIFVVTTNLTLGVQAATRSVPIVFAWVADPVAAGIVEDLPIPGGNATGVTNRYFELIGEQLVLLHELIPAAHRVAVLGWDFDPAVETALRLARPAAGQLGIELIRQPTLYGWGPGVQAAAKCGAQALLVVTSFRTLQMRDQSQVIVDEAMKQRIPVVYRDREAVELGGLMSYATSPAEDLRRGADVLARVLRGESTRALPVDQASKFELVVNLAAARAIGLNVPPSLLARADRVIE